MDRPLQIGVTGGMGAGKSVVCKIFHCLGIPVYDADGQARRLMSTDSLLIAQIKNEFGNDSFRADGSLDRVQLAKLTFGHAGKLEKLNRLVHPRVAMDYMSWIGQQQQHAYVVREAALMYEAGAYKTVDKMVVVAAPEELRIKRVQARDVHRTEDGIKSIFGSQWPEEEKIRRADYVVHNDDLQMVIPQVLHLHGLFLSMTGN